MWIRSKIIENWTKKRASRLQGLDIIASNAQGERLWGSATSLKQSFAETLKCS